MTPQQILMIAVRLFAIVWFLNSIGHLLTILRLWGGSEPDLWFAISVMWPLLELIGCVFLWLFPAMLSRRLLRNGNEPVEKPSLPLLEWQAMVVIAIGLWTLSFALPEAVYWLIHLGTYYRQGATLEDIFEGNWAIVAATVAQVLIGFWLLIGGRGFAAFLFHLRSAGLKP